MGKTVRRRDKQTRKFLKERKLSRKKRSGQFEDLFVKHRDRNNGG